MQTVFIGDDINIRPQRTTWHPWTNGEDGSDRARSTCMQLDIVLLSLARIGNAALFALRLVAITGATLVFAPLILTIWLAARLQRNLNLSCIVQTTTTEARMMELSGQIQFAENSLAIGLTTREELGTATLLTCSTHNSLAEPISRWCNGRKTM